MYILSVIRFFVKKKKKNSVSKFLHSIVIATKSVNFRCGKPLRSRDNHDEAPLHRYRLPDSCRYVYFTLVIVLFLRVHAQTFCEKYAVLFGPDLNVTQIMLMNATVEYAFGRLYTDPRT